MNLSENRFTGIVLMAGTVLGLFVFLFRPGGLLNSPATSSTPLVEKVQILADGGLWTHGSTLLAILSLLMMLFGIWSLRRPEGSGRVSDAVVRFGILAITFAFIAGIVGRAMNHVIVHVMLHLQDPMLQQNATLMAVNLEIVKSGIRIVTSFTGVIGVTLLAFGLYPRMAGAYRVIALVVGVLGVAALVALVIADHIHELGGLYRIANIFSIVLLVWYFILGLEIYRGHPAVTPPPGEDAAG